jgi:hypothetical protein
VKEAALLRAMHRIIRGIQIQHDLGRRRRRVRLYEQVDEEAIHGVMIDRDLFVARLCGDRRAGEFKAIERALAGAGRGEIGRFGEHRDQGIMTQRVVIVQILVPQRESVHALPHERLDRMRDARRIAMVREAGGKPCQEAGRAVGLPEQQRAAVRGQRAAIKPGHHRATRHGLKCQRFRRTLCGHSGRLRVTCKGFSTNTFCHLEGAAVMQ